MTIGLLLTGFIAYFFGKASIVTNEMGQIVGVTQVGALLFGSPLKWIIMLAPLGFVFYLSARINRMSVSAAQITFWLFASIMGLSLASVFIEFTQTSIARVFFITAGTFGAMSLYGYTTKRDLTKLGGFLFMGLIGIIIASVVNIFVGSTALQFAISVIGVLVFVGLTAYDTQNIKNMYYGGDSEEIGSKKIAELMKAVDDSIPTPDRPIDQPFLMPIEDVFSISGRGTVVTGRVERGVINNGDDVGTVTGSQISVLNDGFKC